MCPNSECNSQKQITFTPGGFQLESRVFKITTKRFSEGTQKAWDNFLKPAVNTLVPVIGMNVGAKSNNPQFGQVTTNILKTLSGEKYHH